MYFPNSSVFPGKPKTYKSFWIHKSNKWSAKMKWLFRFVHYNFTSIFMLGIERVSSGNCKHKFFNPIETNGKVFIENFVYNIISKISNILKHVIPSFLFFGFFVRIFILKNYPVIYMFSMYNDAFGSLFLNF